MRSLGLVVVVAMGAALGAAGAGVSVEGRPQVLYHELTDKLRISGSGFGGLGASPRLTFLPEIKKSAYNLTVVSDGVMTLGLKKGGAWPVAADPELGGQSLYLTKIVADGATVLDDPVSVATVVRAPSVQRGYDKVIYMTGTTRFNINGTGFKSKTMQLAFDPPLVADEDYLLAVRSSTCMQLTLRTGKRWRSDGSPGPLKLRRISTGAGYLRIDAKYGGVTVAEVQVDLGAHGVRVETTAGDQKVYQSSPRIAVSGSGFNATRSFNTLKWGNSLRGKGINYTIVDASADKLGLELGLGSKWRRNPANLPAPLLLLAVNAGAGLVPVGPTEAKKGRRVATVYEDPSIAAPKPLPRLFLTHSHELWVTGTGFARGTTALTFKPALKVNEDYVLTVFNRTHALVTLLDGKKWAKAPTTLTISAIDAGAGTVGARYALTNGKDDLKMDVEVAEVVADADAHPSGTYVERTAGQAIYQSGKVKSLAISGGGLCVRATLEFAPSLIEGVDYVVGSATAKKISLKLKKGQKWRADAGPLRLMAVTCAGADRVPLGGGEGIVVATILANPTVEANPARAIYVSQTKRLTIRGTGFALYDDADLTLEPTPRADYTVTSVQNSAIVLELVDGKAWVPPSLVGKSIPPLRVTEVNTGAGMIAVKGDGGVVVATVVADPEGAVCDNSCEFARDGVCDDGSAVSKTHRESVKAAGGWEDDLYGNYYYGDEPYDDDFHYYDDDYYGDYGYYYNYADDAYYGALAAVCDLGTDCDDCSAAAVAGLNNAQAAKCDNSCIWARDGSCDDARAAGPCALGTDCFDCGPVGASNYTDFADDDGWWDDDETYWDDDYDWDDAHEWAGLTYDDDDARPVALVRSTAHPREAKEPRTIGEPGAGGIFVIVLQSVVYLTALVFCGGGLCFLVAQKQAGKNLWQAVPTLDPTDVELAAAKKSATTVPLTGDVAYTGN
jgi:nitrogen fixation protein FixH